MGFGITFDAHDDCVTLAIVRRESRDSAPKRKAPNFATDRTALLLISRLLIFYAERAMQTKPRADWQLRLPQTPEPRTGQ